MEYEKPERDLKFSLHYNAEKEGIVHKVIYTLTDNNGEPLAENLKEVEPRELYAITKILISLTTTFTKALKEGEEDFWDNFDKEVDILGRKIKSDIKLEPEKNDLNEIVRKYDKLFI